MFPLLTLIHLKFIGTNKTKKEKRKKRKKKVREDYFIEQEKIVKKVDIFYLYKLSFKLGSYSRLILSSRLIQIPQRKKSLSNIKYNNIKKQRVQNNKTHFKILTMYGVQQYNL